MNRYANGKVYKLINDVDDEIYIGSTCMPLSKRLYDHKKAAIRYPDRNVYAHLANVGWCNVRIILIETVHAFSREQLIMREQHYIDLLRPKLNRNSAYVPECPHDRIRSYCKECFGASICPHNKRKSECKDCGGSQICQHNRIKSRCKDCGGSQICEHNRIKSTCKECCGASICPHNKRKSTCKDCGGSQICQHNKQKGHCKDCNDYTCHICEKKYAGKGHLNRHYNTITHIINFINF